MANQLKMAMVNAILTLKQHGWSQRRIAREPGIDRETVAGYVNLPGADPKPATTGYDFTSDILPNNRRARGCTVKDIISGGYFPIPRSEPETAIITDKRRTSRLGLNDIIQQIRQRYEIYEKNNYQIKLGKCYSLNSMFAVQSESGGVQTIAGAMNFTDEQKQTLLLLANRGILNRLRQLS